MNEFLHKYSKVINQLQYEIYLLRSCINRDIEGQIEQKREEYPFEEWFLEQCG